MPRTAQPASSPGALDAISRNNSHIDDQVLQDLMDVADDAPTRPNVDGLLHLPGQSRGAGELLG